MKTQRDIETTPIESPITITLFKLNFKNKYPVNIDPKINPEIKKIPRYSADPKKPI